jgi:hypothetical protein
MEEHEKKENEVKDIIENSFNKTDSDREEKEEKNFAEPEVIHNPEGVEIIKSYESDKGIKDPEYAKAINELISHSNTQEEVEEEKEENTEERKLLPAENTTEIVRAEVNLLNFPFFILEDAKKKYTSLELRATINRDGKRVEILWKVLGHPDLGGIPSAFDKKLFNAIQEIIEEIPKPIENSIPLGSIYSLCKRMGISTHGENPKKVRESLQRMVNTTIISENTFYSKEKKEWINDTFHIFDRIVWKGKTLDDDTIADENYLFLGSNFLDNINARYLRPLDNGYYKSFNSPIAMRLYEILGHVFYKLLKTKIGKYAEFRYSTLCMKIPMKRQKYLSKAQQILNEPHKELTEKGYIRKPVWVEIKGKKDDWLIRYPIGEKAKAEYKKFSEEIDVTQVASASNVNFENATLVIKREPPPEELVKYFYKKNNGLDISIPKDKELDQAKRLLDKYGEKIAYFIVDYAIEEAKKTNFKMKTFGAILQYEAETVGKYKTLKKIKQMEEEEKRKREEEERLQEEEKRREEKMAAKIEEILENLSEEELEELYKEAELRAKERGMVFIKAGKPIPEIIVKLCLREIVRKRYMEDVVPDLPASTNTSTTS